jgi:hypothetical protein
VNKIPFAAITSIIPSVMLGIGLGIVFVPPMVFEVSSYYLDREIVEQAMDSPLMISTLPTLSIALLILGLARLGLHGLQKNKVSSLLCLQRKKIRIAKRVRNLIMMKRKSS